MGDCQRANNLLACGTMVDFPGMNEYPPGYFISKAMRTLPAPAPDSQPQTIEIDARPGWGVYRVTFVVMQNPRQGIRNSFWVMDKGERIRSPRVGEQPAAQVIE